MEEPGNAKRRLLKAASGAGIKLHSKHEAQEERHAELVCSTGNGHASSFGSVRSRERRPSQRRIQWRASLRGEERATEQLCRKASHAAAYTVPRRTAACQGHARTRFAGSPV